MTDHRLSHAYSNEEDIQGKLNAYQARRDELIAERGTVRDPDFSDKITDESVKYVQEHGFPTVDVFSLTDIAEAQKLGHELSPVMHFVEADNIIYKPLLGNSTHIVDSRFDDRVAHTERLEYMGTYASNNSVIAVIDGTGRKFVGQATIQNRDFLEQHGYKNVGRNFNVPFSNAETIIGLKDKGHSYGVHMMATSLLGKTVLERDIFDKVITEETRKVAAKVGQPEPPNV